MIKDEDWKPWEETNKWRTKAEFYTWLRGQIRKSIWQNYIPKNEFKASKLKPATEAIKNQYNLSKATKKVGECVYCNAWFPASKLEVDHIQQAGKFNSPDDIKEFIKGIACMKSNMCLTCKPCHDIKSYSERMNISFEEATAQKKAISWIAQNSTETQKSVLATYGLPHENAKDRRESAAQLFRSGVLK